MHPWYRGFVGTVEPKPGNKDKGSYTVTGSFRRVDDVTVEVRVGVYGDGVCQKRLDGREEGKCAGRAYAPCT